MKKFLSFLGSRQFLAFLALLVVALVIWFIGPFVSFGGLKPLAGTGMRVVVITLLLAGVLLWLANLPTSAVFVVLLCLLVWYASPLLAFGKSEPFATESARIIAIAVIVAVFVAYWIILLLRKMHSEPQYLNRLFAFGHAGTPSLAAERLKLVGVAFNGALTRLKSMRTGARGPGRLFQGKRYLYELPGISCLARVARARPWPCCARGSRSLSSGKCSAPRTVSWIAPATSTGGLETRRC